MTEKTYLLCSHKNGVFTVENAIVWDEQQPYAPPDGQSVIVKLGDEWMGWTYAGGKWTAPPKLEAAAADETG